MDISPATSGALFFYPILPYGFNARPIYTTIGNTSLPAGAIYKFQPTQKPSNYTTVA